MARPAGDAPGQALRLPWACLPHDAGMKHVLLIEDEPNVSAFVRKGLEEEGYQVQAAYDGPSGLACLRGYPYDLLILDIALPGLNGWEVCRQIRAEGFTDLPILMLTALGTTENVVKGLDSGADDYLVKPFKFQELLARLRALTRRRNLEAPAQPLLALANLRLDAETKLAYRGEKPIRLTGTEYRLLAYLMRHSPRVISRTELLEAVWGVNFDMQTNVVDVYINYLRKKIDRGYSPRLIHTMIGMGYVVKESAS